MDLSGYALHNTCGWKWEKTKLKSLPYILRIGLQCGFTKSRLVEQGEHFRQQVLAKKSSSVCLEQ